MQMKKNRFVVGDWVTITCIKLSASKEELDRWNTYIGKSFQIESIPTIGSGSYKLNMEYDPIWFDNELELTKPYIINKILSEL